MRLSVQNLLFVSVGVLSFAILPSSVVAQTLESSQSAELTQEEVTEPEVEAEKEASSAESNAEDSAPEKEEKEEKPQKVRKLKAIQIPAIGNTQPWVRFTHFVDYFGDNYDQRKDNDTFMAFVNYMNFGTNTRFKKWKLSTSARVDTQHVTNVGGPDFCDINSDGQVTALEAENCTLENDVRLERLSLRADTKYVKLIAGDYNVSFGRGLPLSIRKINDIGIDATIKGGRVDIRTKPIQLIGIFGVMNRQQSDFATRSLQPDPGYSHVLCDNVAKGFSSINNNDYGNRLWTSCSDIVGGVRAEGKLPGKVRVGGHYANLWFGQTNRDRHEAMHIVGGDVARASIAKHWDVFGGFTTLLRNYHHDEHHHELKETGHGMYLQNNIYFGNTSVVLEGKYYDNYVVARSTDALTVQYTEAPTLEREDQQIPAAANTAGGRIRIDHTLKKFGLTPYINLLGYAFAYGNDDCMFGEGVNAGDWGGSLARAGTETGMCSSHGLMAWHTYGGVNWRDTSRDIELRVAVGYRWEGYQQDPSEWHEPSDDPQFNRKLPHSEIYWNQAIGKWGGFSHSLNARLEWRRETVFKANHEKYFHRGFLVLGYGMSPYLNVSFIGGYSSEFPALEDEPQLHDQPCLGEGCLRKPHFWPGAEIRVNFLTSSFLRVFFGRQVGGLLCVNGSCRVVPDFEGVRADLILGF